jgi:hypothetical protein
VDPRVIGHSDLSNRRLGRRLIDGNPDDAVWRLDRVADTLAADGEQEREVRRLGALEP